ncbi:hypothetical protein KFL_005660040 [Klebsormidium nitens]|uniref:EamA domain-containing protein n=1 Tax=Klebsormidium nitens TaxID=105231 RepID=A0A1Y1IG39_KLENI|nr:hypothetical protein KFL_005660040 [Klebsormidium nitens]|eukprot:GAQ89820.1 hypothetical protein KFL_005660040 [Klebsormidium nitens]
MAIHLPRLSPGWATLLLNVVALTYSTNGVFVKSIETAEPKPLPSLACAVRFFIATAALAILSQVFTSKPCTRNPALKTTADGDKEFIDVPLREVPLPYIPSKQVELNTPRNRRGGRTPLAKRGEEADALFEISLDSAKGSVRATARLSPFGCGPGGWHHDSATPLGVAPHSETKGFKEKWLYPENPQKDPNDPAEKLLGNEVARAEPVGRRLSPVVASLELGVLMFLGFAAQAIALETAMAGHVALLFTISVILVPLLESIGGKPLTPATMIATSLSVIGTGLLEYRGKGLGLALPSFGDTWGILSATAFALHVVRSEVYAKSWRATGGGSETPARWQQGHSSETVPLTADHHKVDVSTDQGAGSMQTTQNLDTSKTSRFSRLALDTTEMGDQHPRDPSVKQPPAAEPWSPIALVLMQTLVVSVLSVVWWVVELSRGLCHVAPTQEMSQLDTATWMETLVYEPTWRQLAHLPWPAMVYTGVVSTGMCEWLEFHCLQSVCASTCVLIYTSISIYGAFFAWLLRGETLGVSGVVGAAVVICASVWVQLAELRTSNCQREGDTCPQQQGKG